MPMVFGKSQVKVPQETVTSPKFYHLFLYFCYCPFLKTSLKSIREISSYFIHNQQWQR